MKQKKTHLDYGLTKNEFLEVVEFFRELIRLDQKGRELENLVQVFRARMHQLANEQRKNLLEQLSRLENL
jgi:hypothetical protein